MRHAIVGIDIGGTKIAGGLVDPATGEVLRSARVPTMAAEGGPAVLARSIALTRDLMATAGAAGCAVAGIGVGAGGQINARTGVVLSATDVLPGWGGTRISEALIAATGIDAVSVDNDVNALAMGETRFGAGRGGTNLLYLSLGTGVGGAIVSGGRLHRSARGVSGELGHLILEADGLRCTCGGRGCLEQYVSGPALLVRYHHLGGDRAMTDGTRLLALARSDPDGPAAQAIRRTGFLLGIGMTSLLNIFGPDRVIVGGGLAELGDLFLDPARAEVAWRALPPVRDVPIVTADLGADAAIVGAASLVLADRSEQ